MTSTGNSLFATPAWSISLTLHGLVVGLAFLFAAQVKPFVPEDVFQWDVALVEGAAPDSKLEQVESVMTPAQPQVKKMLSPQRQHVAGASQTITQTQQKIEPPQPILEAVQPIEPKIEAPQVRVDQAEERIVASPEPKVEQVGETKALETFTAAASPDSMTSVSASSADVPVPQDTPVPVLAQDRSTNAAPVSGPEAKRDHRWLAEALWQRVAELKRYPSSARMSGQEGKVVLKAVIRSDGHLADVSIQRSSGHELLDAAAIEAVKLACPLHMKHVLDKPQIVVSLPIVYSLLTP